MDDDRHDRWDYRDFIQGSKGEFGRQARLRSRHPGGSATAPSAIWLPDVPLWCRTPDGAAVLQAYRVSCPFRRQRRRGCLIRRSRLSTTRATGCRNRDRVLRGLTPFCLRSWRGPADEPAAARVERPLRIAQVAPVATSIPPIKSGSIETMTALSSGRARLAWPPRDALCHGQLGDEGRAARQLSARLYGG